ncbi:MAG: hypothetical protein HY809_06395 [Nitrospirae bacterium]|nr:hypothetical protein [Nitrospirota bacterium]
MKKKRRLKIRRTTDAEIDVFCQSVEAILEQIKLRSLSKKSKKAKDLLPSEEEIMSLLK